MLCSVEVCVCVLCNVLSYAVINKINVRILVLLQVWASSAGN